MRLESVQSNFSRLAPKYRGLRITDLDPILSIKTRLRGFPVQDHSRRHRLRRRQICWSCFAIWVSGFFSIV